jgi:serine/threonine protein kinase
MTTLLHSGHKSLKAAHLWNALSGDEASACAHAEIDPQNLGHYRILECLGSGGMGKVFLAEHTLMARKVAIKVMSAALLSDEDSCSRFRQEVRLVAQLSHPHIVLAHDADEAGGAHYFVMEYVEGADLGHIVAQYGPLPIPFACECIRQTALGLQHAHEHGLVHCDIKPSNLLLRGGMTSVYNYLGRPNGQNSADKPMVKILDFGLARLAGKTAVPTIQGGSPEPGLCGTPDFMAPELGRDSTTVDIRCDLYSLGCTFSFLLTGQVPYPGGSWSEKLIRHHYDPATPVCHMRPDVPRAIAAVIGRLMAKDPVDRFATPGEVAVAIQDWQQSDEPVQKASQPQPSKSRLANSMLTKSLLSLGSTASELGLEAVAEHPGDLVPKVPARHRRFSFLWPVAACLAMAGGLGLAWIVSSLMAGKSVGALPAWATPSLGQTGFRVGPAGTIFSRLDQAIAAAGDGDTIAIQGNGPFLLHGTSCGGKALTIKAAAGFRPRMEFLPTPHQSDWTPLLWSNKDLTLEGIDLSYLDEKPLSATPGVAHLVYIERASLKLTDCNITAKNAQALIVCRQAPSIAIDSCSALGKGSVLCIELPERGSARIGLEKCRFAASDPNASTAVFWASKVPSEKSQLDLKECEVSGSRLIAFNNLDGVMSVRSFDSTFRFQQSLLSVIAADRSLPLDRLLRWEGSNNRFGTGVNWIVCPSLANPVRNLQEWKKCWHSTESGSLEETIAALPAGFHGAH